MNIHDPNIETPKAIGCAISYVDLDFDQGFAIDIERVKVALRPNTKLISVTCPHNPTGTMMSRTELDALIALAESRRCRLLVDETYRDLSYGERLPCAASLSLNAISVSSLSKAFGIPGVRIGWMAGPKDVVEECWSQHDYITIGHSGLRVSPFCSVPEVLRRAEPAGEP